MKGIGVNDTSLYLNQKDYFEKLKCQLSKDFGDDDFDYELDQICLEDSKLLPQLVYRFLDQLFSRNTESLFQLMYRIDIPDKDMQSIVFGSGLDFYSLADLVLKRELLKILFREKYSV